MEAHGQARADGVPAEADDAGEVSADEVTADEVTPDDVLVDVDADGVALVTLNRPALLNAMTPAMHVRYVRTLRELDADPAVRSIVVTGAGRGWCAGADLSSLAEILQGGRFEATAHETGDVDRGWAMTIDTPTIAAVNGPVAGMGFPHMLMADVRYAAAGARIGTTFARLGLVAEWGSAWLLTRLVGSAQAADLLLSGDIHTAEELCARGVVHKVLPAEELLPAAMAWARNIAVHCSPRATAAIKAQLRRCATQTPEAAFAESVELMLDSFGWPDLTEAITARAERRPPVFPPHPARLAATAATIHTKGIS